MRPSQLLLAFGATLALLTAACAPSPSGEASPAPSAAPAKLTVGFSNITADNLSLWVAVESGIAQRNGLDINAQYVEGGTRTMAALLAGEIHMGHLGGSESISAAAGGADLVILATLSPVYPYLFMVPADIKSPADLKGKKVGVSSIGGSADIATRVGLRSVGLDADKDVSIVAVGSHANRTAALLSGSIQGGVDDPPDSVKLEANGFHALFDLAAKKIPAANDVVVTRRAWLEANRALAQRYIDTIVQAIAAMRKDRSIAVSALKKYFQPEDERAMNIATDFFLNEVLPPLPYPRLEHFADSLAELSKKNEKLRGFDVSKMLDSSYVQSAADRGLNK